MSDVFGPVSATDAYAAHVAYTLSTIGQGGASAGGFRDVVSDLAAASEREGLAQRTAWQPGAAQQAADARFDEFFRNVSSRPITYDVIVQEERSTLELVGGALRNGFRGLFIGDQAAGPATAQAVDDAATFAFDTTTGVAASGAGFVGDIINRIIGAPGAIAGAVNEWVKIALVAAAVLAALFIIK